MRDRKLSENLSADDCVDTVAKRIEFRAEYPGPLSPNTGFTAEKSRLAEVSGTG